MGDRSKGLDTNPPKYNVSRTDGSDQPGGKHHGCEHFVLDVTHDLHARRALLAYATSAELDGYEQLAADLRAMVERNRGGRSVVHYPTGDPTKPKEG